MFIGLFIRLGAHDKFKDFVDKYESVLKVLLARSPQMIFIHFHFLLEDTQLLQRFIHIVHAQVSQLLTVNPTTRT